MTSPGVLPIYESPYGEKELQKTRAELLTSIYRLRDAKDLDEVGVQTLRTEKAVYNSTVDSLNELQRAYRSDPMTKLPPELFSRIVYDTVFTGTESLDMLNANQTILTLTLVSQGWMTFFTSTPMYWTHVILDEDRPDYLACASACLQLSRGLPITLHVRLPFTFSDALRKEILKHRGRIKSIHVTPSERSRSPLSKSLWKFIADLFSTSHLQDRVASYQKSVDISMLEFLLEEFPSLTEITRILFSEEMLQLLGSRNWKRIQIWSNFDSVLPILSNIRSLDTIICSHAEKRNYTMPRGASTTDGLFNWRTLGLGLIDASFPFKALNRMANLEVLSVATTPAEGFELLKNIHQLSQLKTLGWTLITDALFGVKFEHPSSVVVNRTVAALSLSLVRSKPLKDLNTVNTSQTPFLRVVIQTLPGIKILTLSSFDAWTMSEMDEILQPLHLQRLTIVTETRMELYIDSNEVPPCESLELKCPASSAIRLSSSKVTRLHIERRPNNDELITNTTFNDRLWPSLEKLTVPYQLISPSQMTLCHLRELTFRDSAVLWEGNVTRFCYYLARDPEQLPALEALYLEQYPEWDIYFIMLERRLLWSANGSKAFKSIGLPSCTPQKLLVWACEILQGRLPEREDNLELSVFGDVDVLLDETMCVYSRVGTKVLMSTTERVA
jgi:hypothetical protein